MGATLQETMEVLSSKFGEEVEQLLTCVGAVLDDVTVLRLASRCVHIHACVV